MTGYGHRTMRVPLGERVRHRIARGTLRHRRSMRKRRFLTAPARCGSAHRGSLVEVNYETGAGRIRECPAKRTALEPSRGTALQKFRYRDGRACSEVGAW
jgi:hypothetical protein